MTRGGKRQGAGRKPAPARAGITVRVDTATAARFVAYCAAKHISQSAAFTAWVSRLPNDKISHERRIQLPSALP